MKNPSLLAPYFRRLESLSTARWYGRVTKAVGHLVESEGPFCSLGECCEIVGPGGDPTREKWWVSVAAPSSRCPWKG